MAKHIVSVDIESYSEADLPKVGVHKYVEHPSFEILLIGYALDDDPVTVLDLTKGDSTEEFEKLLFDPDIIKSAFNAAFERTCFRKHFQREMPPEEWSDTMILASYAGLPRSLKQVGQALRLNPDEAKMDAGTMLIKYFSVPCKPTKINGGRTRNLPRHDPGKWATYIEYNRRDVETERIIRNRLRKFSLPPMEQKLWEMDQKINDRGVMVDVELARNAMEMAEKERVQLMDEAQRITGMDNPNSVAQLKEWLGLGAEVTLRKKDVEGLLATESDSVRKRILAIRQEIGKSSVKKYEAMVRAACDDGRVRGTTQFYKANRTGRWAGSIVQPQNLPRNSLENLDLARDLVRAEDVKAIREKFGSLNDTLSQLVRTAIIPKPGCVFAVADFSAIEARVLAWLAGEEWRMESFREGKDIYCESASAMFHVPVVKHGINGELRQKGKIAELACIAAGQLVLTDQGETPIEKVTTDMKVWDGEEWVSHDGVIYKGERNVITYEGLTATPDHLVFIEGQSEPVELGFAAASGAHLIQAGAGRQAVRACEDYQPGEALEREMESLLSIDAVPGLWSDSMDGYGESEIREIEGMPELLETQTDSEMAGEKTDSCKEPLREPEEPGISSVRGSGDQIRVSNRDQSRTVPDRAVWSPGQSAPDRPDRQQWELCSWEYPICFPNGELCEQKHHRFKSIRSRILALFGVHHQKKAVVRVDTGTDHRGRTAGSEGKAEELERYSGKARVYDIRNAGRHHRFTVSGKLVHNCGYGGGVGAMVAMGALDMGLSEEELPGIIEKWRTASPNIVHLWWNMDAAFKQAIRRRGKSVLVNGPRPILLLFRDDTAALSMALPSGRLLNYIRPRLGVNRFGGESFSYEGNDAGHWGRIESFGARATENAVQAIARDCLALAMLRVSQMGYNIVFHVHDEMIVEVEEDKAEKALQDMLKAMSDPIPWAKDLLLKGDGYLCNYYKKD